MGNLDIYYIKIFLHLQYQVKAASLQQQNIILIAIIICEVLSRSVHFSQAARGHFGALIQDLGYGSDKK